MTIHDIQVAVTLHCGVTMLDLLSRRRGRYIARPRQVAMWLCRNLTLCSFPEIGREFGNRDHTTVMHAVEVIDGEVAAGGDWGVQAATMKQELAGRDAP